MEPGENHPLNLNSTEFDPEAYVNNLLKKKGLDELVAVEEDMVQNVRRLDAEMQQLVYENYNKFLTATNTVRNMQIEFGKMDEEMKSLSDSMKKISSISESLNGVFNKHRENVRKLTDASKTVKSLQYVVKLPQKLQTYIDQKDYKRAVRTFAAVKPKLVQYKDIPSMAGIYNDSVEIMSQLEQQLKERLSSRIISSEEIIDGVKMLRQLEYPEEDLEKEMLKNWKDQLQTELENLEKQADSNTVYVDVLEYVDNGCCSFLTNISLAASLYPQLFKTRREGEMMDMIDQLMHRLEKAVLQRFHNETNPRECALYVRALDRIYRKNAASCRLLSGLDFSNMNINLVIKATKHQIGLCRFSIGSTVDEVLIEIAKETNSPTSPSTVGSMSIQDILQYIHKLEQNFLIAVKTSLANLLLFTASDITFAGNDPTHFFSTFGMDVHEEIVIGSIKDLIKLADFYEKGHGEKSGLSPTFYLIFAQFLFNTHGKHISYLMDLCKEQFRLVDRANKITNQESVKITLFSGAELLLKKYVEVQGGAISQLLVKSIESRDWLECAEPQSVRAVIKKVIEYIDTIDQQIKPLMEHDSRKERTPESIRSTGSAKRSKKSSYDTGSLSSALEKLWNERVDYFATVEFKRDSMLNAIVKISLKAFVEIVRLQIFERHGLEQMQIDCCYLKQHLWKYMMDEHALNSLIDEVITSVVNQCVDPKILDPSYVKQICENT